MHSHVSLSEAACQTSHSNVSDNKNIGQYDVAEGIKMSVSYLEQELLRMKDCTAEEMAAITKLLYELCMSEKEDSEKELLYSSLVEKVLSQFLNSDT